MSNSAFIYYFRLVNSLPVKIVPPSGGHYCVTDWSAKINCFRKDRYQSPWSLRLTQHWLKNN